MDKKKKLDDNKLESVNGGVSEETRNSSETTSTGVDKKKVKQYGAEDVLYTISDDLK